MSTNEDNPLLFAESPSGGPILRADHKDPSDSDSDGTDGSDT